MLLFFVIRMTGQELEKHAESGLRRKAPIVQSHIDKDMNVHLPLIQE